MNTYFGNPLLGKVEQNRSDRTHFWESTFGNPLLGKVEQNPDYDLVQPFPKVVLVQPFPKVVLVQPLEKVDFPKVEWIRKNRIIIYSNI